MRPRVIHRVSRINKDSVTQSSGHSKPCAQNSQCRKTSYRHRGVNGLTGHVITDHIGVFPARSCLVEVSHQRWDHTRRTPVFDRSSRELASRNESYDSMKVGGQSLWTRLCFTPRLTADRCAHCIVLFFVRSDLSLHLRVQVEWR